jgi:hypothetical protein
LEPGLFCDIVIVNYNSTRYLIGCLESIYHHLNGHTANVYIIDNGSTDGPDAIPSKFPHARMIFRKHNSGFASAVNAGIKKGDAPYVLILNPDTLILDKFFDNLFNFLENNPDVGALGPKILDQDNNIQGSARAFPTPATALFGRNSLLSRMLPQNRVTRKNILTSGAEQNQPMPVDWVSGACMMVRREAVASVGGLDEQFFMYWEDADWCKRMKNRGWRVIYYPKATILHFVGGSSEKNLLRSVVEFHKSAFRFFNKHYAPVPFWMNALAVSGFLMRIGFVLMFHLLRRISRNLWVLRSF